MLEKAKQNAITAAEERSNNNIAITIIPYYGPSFKVSYFKEVRIAGNIYGRYDVFHRLIKGGCYLQPVRGEETADQILEATRNGIGIADLSQFTYKAMRDYCEYHTENAESNNLASTSEFINNY